MCDNFDISVDMTLHNNFCVMVCPGKMLSYEIKETVLLLSEILIDSMSGYYYKLSVL